MANAVAAAWTSRSLLNRYDFRPLRALRWRSVAFCRPSYGVPTRPPAGGDPNATRVSTEATRPSRRSSCTVA